MRDRLGNLGLRLPLAPPMPPILPCVSALRERHGAVITLSEDVLVLAPFAGRVGRFQNKSPDSGVLQRLQSGYLSLSVVPLQKLSEITSAKF